VLLQSYSTSSANLALLTYHNKDDTQQILATADTLLQKMNYSIGLTFCRMFSAVVDVELGKFTVARSLFQKCHQSAWGTDTEAGCLLSVENGGQSPVGPS
jgi:hypothetical protein